MSSWISRALALTGLVGSLMVAVLTPPAQAAPVHYCDDGKPAPCLVSVLRNGTPVDRSVYLAMVDGYTPPEDRHTTGFTLMKQGFYGLGPGELGSTFTVTMKTGTIKPRVIDGWGRNGRSTRYIDSDGDWAVKIAVKPADMLMSCGDEPGEDPTHCDETAAPDDHISYVVMRISDASWHGRTEAVRDEVWGLESYSDIQLFWYPPNITTSSTGVVTMDFLMQNAHNYPDGSTFHGTANMRIPNRVLRDLYGIPAPETMTAGSFTSTSTSGSVASYQESGDDAWRVDLTGVTFSRQHLKLKRGVITPTRPDITRTKRVRAGSARLTFVTSKPRGARVKGYQVRCVSGGGHVVLALKSATRSPVSIWGLRRGAAYTCKIRAKSQVGWSTWSLGHKVKSKIGAVS